MEQASSNSYESFIITPNVDIALKDFLKMQKRYPVIAITWQPWIGKSTISRQLSNMLWAELYTELPENNVNLNIIKQTKWKVNDVTLWGNNQNYFLATDVNQITKAFILSKEKPIVFDFALTQPFIFSDMKLSWTSWLKVFNSIYEHQFSSLPKPDIVIELKANSSVLIDRLAKRWKHIDKFVIKMTEQMEHYYKSWIVKEHYSWDETKIIEIDNNLDLSPEDLRIEIVNNVLEQIKKVS